MPQHPHQQRRSVTPSVPAAPASQNQLPPGYLTAQSFRQRAKRRTLGAPVELQTSTCNLQRKSQSREGSYDNLADCSRASVASGATKMGLERALLRLDQRRVLRHPKAYQHHHWRITPAECNALFLCKVTKNETSVNRSCT